MGETDRDQTVRGSELGGPQTVVFLGVGRVFQGKGALGKQKAGLRFQKMALVKHFLLLKEAFPLQGNFPCNLEGLSV